MEEVVEVKNENYISDVVMSTNTIIAYTGIIVMAIVPIYLGSFLSLWSHYGKKPNGGKNYIQM